MNTSGDIGSIVSFVIAIIIFQIIELFTIGFPLHNYLNEFHWLFIQAAIIAVATALFISHLDVELKQFLPVAVIIPFAVFFLIAFIIRARAPPFGFNLISQLLGFLGGATIWVAYVYWRRFIS
ncbi:hypothetical protein JCM17823_21500 [Halorubrum gandharaense]